MSILNLARNRGKIQKNLVGTITFCMMFMILMAAGFPRTALAGSVGSVVAEVVSRNLKSPETYSGVEETTEPGGKFRFNSARGGLEKGTAQIVIDEPLDGTSMQAIIDMYDFVESQIIPMQGYEIKQGTPEFFPDDLVLVVELPDYLIRVKVVNTGKSKASDLQTAKSLLQQLLDGLERDGLLSLAAPDIKVATPAEEKTQPGTSAVATGKPLDEPVKISDTMNIAGVYNGPTVPTTFTISSPHLVTYISTYHWNNARGAAGGTIALQGSDGKVYGPWQVSTRPGQGGVPNAYWEVSPNVVIPAGTYTVIDSDPATWSQNSQSGGKGMGEVKATPHFEVTGGSGNDPVPGAKNGSRANETVKGESPAGVGAVGKIPGPSNVTEAVVGVAVPGLIATVLGALAGSGGGGGLGPPLSGTPIYPSGGGHFPGAGGTPGTGTGPAGIVQATNQIGRRKPGDNHVPGTVSGTGYVTEQDTSRNNVNDEILIDTKDMFEGIPAPGSAPIIDTADETGMFVQSEPGIIVETVEEGGGIRPGSSTIIDTAEEAGVFVQPGSGIIIETIQEEAGIIKPGSGIMVDDSDSGILIDTSALEDKPPVGAEANVADSEAGKVSTSGTEVEATVLSEESTYDREGFNKEGYDAQGYDREGFNKEGFDAQGYDREGFNKEGFDAQGYDREGFNKEGYDAQGYDREGFNKEGFDAQGYDREGFNKEGFDAQGYDREGFNKEGYDAQGYDREGFNKEGFDAQGYDREGFNKEGYDAQGYDREGFNKEGFNAQGYDREGFNKEGFNAQGYDREGLNKEGYDAQGYDREGFNKEGYDAQGYDREGYGRNGFDAQGFDRDGFDINGYNAKGYNRSGYDAEGYNAAGLDKEGFNKQGWDREGYDRDGFNEAGWDPDGYDKAGYDRQGYNREGRSKAGYDESGYDENGYDKDGYNENGVDKDGFDREGFDYEGYNRNGYDPWGYDKRGYGKDGYHWSGYNADGYDRSGRHWSENPFERDSSSGVHATGSPFDVDTGGDGVYRVGGNARSPFDGEKVIPHGVDPSKWKPEKPPLGEPYPQTVEKYGAKPWTDEIPQPEAEKPSVPVQEDTGVIGPEDPMNTLKNHDIGEGGETVPEGQPGPGRSLPEEGGPENTDIPGDTPVDAQGTDTFEYTDPETGLTSTYEYEPGYNGPRQGDRQILVGKGDGQTYEVEFNAVKGKWINTESGNEFDPDEFDRWQNDVAEDRSRSAADLAKMGARQDAHSQAVDQNLADWKRLEQMQKAAEKYNIGEPGGPGDVDKAIQKLKDDMLAGKEIDRGRMEQINKIIDGRIQGKTTADTGERWKEDWFKNLGWALEANAATAKEVVTGEKADGSFSGWGTLARIMITAASGGVTLAGGTVGGHAVALTSGFVMDGALTVAEAMYRIKDSVEKGESDFRAVSKAIGMVVLSEELSWLAGKAGGKLMGEMLERFPAFTNKAADFIESSLLRLSAKNQMLSKALGLISKESAEESIDQINRRLVDIGSDETAKGIIKNARVDYGLSVANSFDDVTKAGKAVTGSGDNVLKGTSKLSSSGWSDTVEGGGKVASGSVDGKAKVAGKAVTATSDDMAKGGGRAVSGRSDNIAKGTGKTASETSDNAVKRVATGVDDGTKTTVGPDRTPRSGAAGDGPGDPGGRPPGGGNDAAGAAGGNAPDLPLNRGARTPEEVLADPAAVARAENTVQNNVRDFDRLPPARQQELIREQAIYDEYRMQAEERTWNLAEKVQRGEPLTVRDIIEMKSDPASMRTLKNIREVDGLGSQLTPQEAQRIQTEFNRTMDECIHQPSYRSVENHLSGRFSGTTGEIRCRTVRTPGAQPDPWNINTDNDVVAERLVNGPNGPEWVEIPKSEWEDVYYKSFAENSGFSVDEAARRFPDKNWADMDDAARYREWAGQHEEGAMDQFDPMAARDFSDQRTAILNGERPEGPLLDREGRLLRDPLDSEQLGMMEKHKMNDYWNKGDTPAEIMKNQTESLEQLRKTARLADSLEGCTQSMPPNMQEAVKVINNNDLSPALRIARLQELGYQSPGDLTEKLTSRIGAYRIGNR